VAISPFSLYGGSEEGYLMVVQDITARRRAEASLRRAERADLLGQLAIGLAHDLNNDLTAMLGFAEMLALNTTDAKVRERSQMILTAGRHASGLNRNLLTMTRCKVTHAAGVDLGALISEVVGMAERVMDRRIAVRSELMATRVVIQADADQLHSALLNLALNARDAMPKGGDLRISSNIVVFSREEAASCTPGLEAGTYVRIAFTDTGMGMDEAVLRRIFDPFFTTKSGGSGLGLPSVLACMRQHDGGLEVRTVPGKGSSFALILPLPEGPPAAPP